MKNEALQSSNINDYSPSRPFSVSILIILVLIFTTMNLLRMVTAIRSWDFLTNLLPDVPMFYLVITGGVWSVIGIPLAGGLFSRRKWSLPMARVTVILYTIYYWFDRLLIAERVSIASRWQFVLGLTILLLVLSFWILERPKTKEFLMK